MLSEIYRVLKTGGYYICLSHGMEHQRMKYLQTQKFAVDVKKIPKPDVGISFKPKDNPKKIDAEKYKNHFCYVCKKADQMSAMSTMAGQPITSQVKEN